MSKNIKKFQFSFFGREEFSLLEKIVSEYLKKINKSWLYLPLIYILTEVISNYNKSIIKRYYFKKKSLDIYSHSDYQKGIENFHLEMSQIKDLYIMEMDKEAYLITLELLEEEDSFNISIRNNIGLVSQERDRIHEKFEKAKHYDRINELLEKSIDTTEGSGLGIFLIILMLRKIGLDERVISIHADENETNFQVKIPLNLIGEEGMGIIAEKIIQEIEKIPQFPEHVHQLQEIINNENATFSDISATIEKDPSMIAELLRCANSPIYRFSKKIATIEEAVKVIGFQGVKNMIITFATEHILMNLYNIDIIKSIMAHSIEVAFYASRLVENLNFKKLKDDFFMGAMLHDIGKILIYAIEPKILNKVENFCHKHGLRRDMIEDLTNGYNHPIIGAALAETWYFPDSLIHVIKYHHYPMLSDLKYYDFVTLIYLADVIYYYNRNEYPFEDINYRILEKFGFNSKKKWDTLTGLLYSELKEYGELI